MKSNYLHFVSGLSIMFFLITFRPSYSQWTTAGSVTGVGTFPSISVVNKNIVWIAGGPSGSPQVRRTLDGGVTWTTIPTTGITLELYCVWGIDANTAYVGDGGAAGGAGGNATFYKTVNAGATWTVVGSTSGTAGFINAIAFSKINPLIGATQSDPPLGAGTPYYISKTLNGGTTWAVTSAQNPPGVAGAASSQNSLVVIDDLFYGFGLNAGASRVYLTADGGTTWTVQPLNITGGFISGFAFKEDKLIGLAASSASLPNISRTVDGGATWTSLATGAGVTGYCNLKWIEKSSTAYLSGAVGAGGVVKKSTDDGLTWTIMTTAGVAAITHMEFRRVANTVYGYAVNSAGTVIKLTDAITPINTSTLNLKANLEACPQDSVSVLVRSSVSPYLIVDSAKASLSPTGTAAITFTNVFNGINYYIVVKHRNSIETWSKSGGEIFTAGLLNYDFTTAASQAFGNNMVLVGSEYSFYTGDVNQDGVVDVSDNGLIDNDAFNFVGGYVVTDLNCDNVVDVTDASFADNNGFNFIAVVRP